MKEITIVWKHYDRAGETCTRCNNTGDNIKSAIAEFEDAKVNYVEIKLEAKDMAISNSVLINGRLIKDVWIAVRSADNPSLFIG